MTQERRRTDPGLPPLRRCAKWPEKPRGDPNRVARRPEPGRETTGGGRETTPTGSRGDHGSIPEASHEASQKHPTSEASPTLELVAPVDDPRPSPFDQAVEAWNQLAKANGGGHSSLKPSRGIGKRLKACLDEHPLDDLLGLWRWYWTGADDRARFLRDKGYGLKTLLRDGNIDDYVARSKAPPSWDASNARGAHLDELRKGPQGADLDEAMSILDELRDDTDDGLDEADTDS